jgi:dTDP-4-amino-4,6-dideoxygalactose transaminase
MIERTAYALLAGSKVYPLEVGNYEPLPAREFDAMSRFMLRAFVPLYRDALSKKRDCAQLLRAALAPCGFAFQTDERGEHIYTSLSVEPPPGCDADHLKAFLRVHGIKASSMWRNALGVSKFGQRTWNANPQATPVATRLAQRLIQLPVSRFQTSAQSRRIVELCRRFASNASRSGVGVRVATNPS